MHKALRLVALLTVSAFAVSCQYAVGPVNRVQPNALSKTAFAGEWYFLQTVIDTPYTEGFTFVGEQSELTKITWEIQEHYLLARRSYEWINGAEGTGITGEATETGAAVAMYAIESHFDIRREYNSTTGEESNVVVENSSDRPWNQRDYMRVDWSKNFINGTDVLSIAKYDPGIVAEPVAYYVQDPTDPNHPKFETDESGVVNYMDIVNKMFVQPTTITYDGESFPSCWLYYHEWVDCSSSEITIRNSFLRVDESRDYQPMDYTGDRMERAGYFVAARPGYDPQYGAVESARHRFVDRHNLWDLSHRTTTDAQGLSTLVECTTSEDCSDGRGSVCDMDLAKANRTRHGACTIPYRDRDVRKIAYWVTPNFPTDLWNEAQHLVDGWNGAFVQTVASLRENECLGHGGDAASCAPERTRDDGQRVFVLCHSPVVDEDDDACGAVGSSATIGDLRYSMIGWVDDPHADSPLGYGPSAVDPTTGEIISGSAFVYGAGVDQLATYARDIVALLNGTITEEDVTSGRNVEAWVERMQAPGSSVTGRPASDHAIQVDGHDAARFNRAMDFQWAHPRAGVRSARPHSAREANEARTQARDRLYAQGAYGRGDDRGPARLQGLRGTPIERMLTTPEVRMAAGVDPQLPVTEDVLDRASPLRGMDLRRMNAAQRLRSRMRARNCVMQADFADDGLLGLARAIKDAHDSGDGTVTFYGVPYRITNDAGDIDYERVRDVLRHPAFEAVTAHEVGHTLGLRHNFSGSYDSLNYSATYWELRDDGDMRPRMYDPLSSTEISGRIREYQYSTVMDYGHNYVVSDAAGIGHYDVAAIKLGYGDLMEVFANAQNPHEMAYIAAMQHFGWEVILKESSYLEGGEITAYQYTDMPGVLGGRDRLEQRADVPFTSIVPENDPSNPDVVDYDNVMDGRGRPIVPYLFCSDEQSDLSPDCQLYDAGADPYEAIQSLIDAYWNYYIFANFRRGRLGYDVDAYADRIYWRYFSKLQSATQVYVLNRSYMEQNWAGDPSLDAFWTRPDGYASWTTGTGATFDLFRQVIANPEPGAYGLETRPDGSDALTLTGAGTPIRNVRSPDARYLETSWNFNDGYYWFDELERAGYFTDKTLALMMMTDPTTYFIGKDTSADARTYEINYYSAYAPALTEFMASLMSEDWTRFAPRIASGELVYPNTDELMNGTATGVPVDPQTTFSIQLWAAVFGMALIPETYSQNYLDQARIFVRGGAEGVEIDPSLHTVEFTDRVSGLTYVARAYGDDTHPETGVGARMLLHAQALYDNGESEALAQYMDNINIVRSLTWQYGFGI
ncbi:MAG: zinc-dependent metalloprotease [Sandaracinaceae bacterium]|jgi:hypothetical protein|nr:zinc-dependent metalloprotease [Sandaracinaceae bacterium]